MHDALLKDGRLSIEPPQIQWAFWVFADAIMRGELDDQLDTLWPLDEAASA
jgi:hypothetical protein